MAQKGKAKRFILTLVLVALVIVVFVLLGGGQLLKTAGKKLVGAGKQAEEIKQEMQDKASTIEKTVEKLKESDKGEKK